MRLRLIVNPLAGGGRAERLLPGVQTTLERLGLEHTITRTRDIEHARELARGAAQIGEAAVAFGGDGLIGAVAGALRGTPGVLGLLPGGRGNDFVRTLGIPQEPEQACEVLRSGAVRRIDLGEVDGRTFIGIASCGFDSEANRIANETRLVRGNLVYAYGALRALLSWRHARFTVTLDDGQPLRFTGYTVAAANGQAYGGGMLLAPNAELDDGALDVVLVSAGSKLRFVRLLPTVFRGEHVNQPQVQVLRGAEVRIEADRPFTVYADGDPIGELPVSIRAVPAGVQALVPA